LLYGRVAEWQTCLPAGRRTLPEKCMSYFVYALKSQSRNYIYVGLTNNLERRIFQHQTGKERTTKPYRPYTLIYYESFSSRQLARDKEKYLKSGVGKEFLKSLE
jgi:putative endonuclease